jgi:hypothetical protein
MHDRMMIRCMAGLALVLALAGLIPRRAWRLGRLVVTAIHECGHAVAALLTGRKVSAVHLRADSSGVTIHRGALGRPGRMITAAAGYPAPGAVGVAGAWLIANHHATWWLAVLAGLGAAMAVLWVRNLFGLALLLIWVAGLGWLLVSGSPTVDTLVGAAVAWYLVLGGLRAAAELFGDRSQSDARDLGRLAHLPTVVCKAVFTIVAAGAVAGCAWLLFAGHRGTL